MMPVRVLEQGHHFHYSVTSKKHFRAKYEKLAWEPDTWPCGTQVEYPKRLFRNVCTSMNKIAINEYLDNHVYLSNSQCEQLTQTGEILLDDSVDLILSATASGASYEQISTKIVQALYKRDVCKPERHDPPLLPESGTLGAGQLVETFCRGVLGLGIHEDKYYSWTKSHAEIPIRALAGNYWLVISLGPLHGLVDKRSIGIELNEHKFTGDDIRIGGTEIRVLVTTK
jgi:hypothetical protein